MCCNEAGSPIGGILDGRVELGIGELGKAKLSVIEPIVGRLSGGMLGGGNDAWEVLPAQV
jgi:hypothetical protein